MKKILPLLLLTPIIANAECTPAPDCASIGYTETSCEGDSLKCPFDTSKLFCVPCDSSFRYDCSGENITRGTGSACGGKYVSCECVAGAVFNNGACICDTSCQTIGNIVYSDKTCSSCVNTSKTAIAVVVHSDNNTSLITPLIQASLGWASGNTDVTTLPNLTSDLAQKDMNGVENSQLIRDFFASDDETNNASWYCYNLKIKGFEDKKGEWYLPAAGEIYNYFHINIATINSTFSVLGLSSFSGAYWSSSEGARTYAWRINTNGDIGYVHGKLYNFRVGCLLSIH